jgi:phytoene desaturase
MNQKESVLIIGAGPGGLTAGMILQSRGFDVTILEKEDRVGGRNAYFEMEGYKFDIGPTFLVQKFSLDEMFKESGRKSEDYLDFMDLDPMYRHYFSADDFLDVTKNHEVMIERIEEKFPGNSDGYRKFLKKETQKFRRLFPCLQRPYPNLASNVNFDTVKALPDVLNKRSLHQEISRYFNDEKLSLSFTFQAKYIGMSPWKCPSIFTIIPFIEHAFGVQHVKGGLAEISVAMAKVFEEDGGKILLNHEVESINVKNRKIESVDCKNGEIFKADHTIINSDFGYTMSKLVKPKDALPEYSESKLKKKGVSCSTFMLYLGVDGEIDLPVHNIYFAKDYRKNVEEIVENKKPSEDLSFYVRNATAEDDTLSPKGKTNLYVLVPTINTRAGYDWESNKKWYRDLVIEAIEKIPELKGLSSKIEVEKIITPDDWENNYNVYEGAVFNLSHVLKQMLSFRPRNKFNSLKDTYLTGGGTHPGSGLPTIYESGRIAANHICESAGVDFKRPDSIEQYLKEAGL